LGGHGGSAGGVNPNRWGELSPAPGPRPMPIVPRSALQNDDRRSYAPFRDKDEALPGAGSSASGATSSSTPRQAFQNAVNRTTSLHVRGPAANANAGTRANRPSLMGKGSFDIADGVKTIQPLRPCLPPKPLPDRMEIKPHQGGEGDEGRQNSAPPASAPPAVTHFDGKTAANSNGGGGSGGNEDEPLLPTEEDEA